MFLLKLIAEDHIVEIPINISKYNTFFNRLRGLMFRLKPIVNEGIILEPCNSIHMFFMFFPIDVVFLDDQNRIVYLKENVRPWSVILPKKHAQSVIELPTETISHYGFTIGKGVQLT